jgi:hypothetical protein
VRGVEEGEADAVAVGIAMNNDDELGSELATMVVHVHEQQQRERQRERQKERVSEWRASRGSSA